MRLFRDFTDDSGRDDFAFYILYALQMHEMALSDISSANFVSVNSISRHDILNVTIFLGAEEGRCRQVEGVGRRERDRQGRKSERGET